MPLIAVVNQSTLVKDADINTMCLAIQKQLDLHMLPAFDMKEGRVAFFEASKKIPNYAWVIRVIDDDTQQEGALGYHEETQDGRIDGYIMAKPILSNGGGVMIFDASDPGQYTVSATLSHEVVEIIGDPYTCTYCDNDRESWCYELCDPVEQIGYGIQVGNETISVSDFVFPSFFNANAKAPVNGPFNYLKSLKTPFTILDGGYAITRRGGPGTESQTFGPAMPEWRRECKRKAFSRGGRCLDVAGRSDFQKVKRFITG
jgi:hypothetical protein